MRSNVVGVYIKLHRENDADILEKLGSLTNKQGYIKQLIRFDIEREKVMKTLKETM